MISIVHLGEALLKREHRAETYIKEKGRVVQARCSWCSGSRKDQETSKAMWLEPGGKNSPSKGLREAPAARVYRDLLLKKGICIMIWIPQGSHIYFCFVFA